MFNYDNLSIAEATQLQLEMQEKIKLTPLGSPIKKVAGADISYNKFSSAVYAGIVLLSYPDMKPLAYSLIETEINFPYVPGYLAFREIPAIKIAYDQLREKPDVMIMDGQGIVHPRKMGVASHFGLLENIPAIGCGKTMLFGKYNDLAEEKFSISPIYSKDEILGYALRTQTAINPVFISPGHLVTLDQTVEIMKNCTGKYRIPEPTRLADQIVNALRRGELASGYHEIKDGKITLQ
jgi:deoxyribonuclease V